MAGESLGTMVVGVTANIDPAQAAITRLAESLENFTRKMERGSSMRPPVFQQMDQHVRDYEKSLKDAENAYLKFESMGKAGRGQTGLDDLEKSANRARFAVLNLGYGVQDAVTVFGTSGLAGAVRASANNLQGLGVLLDQSKGGFAGVKTALMSAEFGIMAVATGALLAANAWDAYNKSVEEAARKGAEARFANFRPERAVQQAGRMEGLNQELLQMTKAAVAEDRLLDAKRKQAVAQAELNAGLQQEAVVAKNVADIEKQLELARGVEARMRRRPRAGQLGQEGADPLIAPLTQAERDAMARGTVQLQADLNKALEVRNDLAKKNADRLREARDTQAEVGAIEGRIDQLQPQKIDAAKKELERLQEAIKVIDERSQKEDAITSSLTERQKKLKEEDDLAKRVYEKQFEQNERLAKATIGTRKAIRDSFKITPEEEAAQSRVTSVEGREERRQLATDLAANAEKIRQTRDQKERLQKDLEQLFNKYPQLRPDSRLGLEQEESDIEYRLQFLGRRRREIVQSSRSAMRNVPAATFESSAAYEALARSRMASDPQSDTLQKILRAEESATKALEDIREKLDPGRRARLAILESLE